MITRKPINTHTALLLFVLGVFSAVGIACSRNQSVPVAETCVPMESDVLHNLIHVDGRIFSGGEPHGPESFAALRELGVKTIVSVDGAQPDVAAAQAEGIRYVHLPIGYDKVTPEMESGMARLLQEESGPIYVHCHHGKHRGPAAASILWSLETGQSGHKSLKLMEVAHTSESYGGLWDSVREFEPASVKPSEAPLPSVAPVESVAAQMAKIDRVWDNLTVLQKNGWKPDATHPDVDPVNESLIFAEGFKELMRLDGDDFPLAMWSQMDQSSKAAAELHRAVESRNIARADALLADLKNRCNKCHAEYRN